MKLKIFKTIIKKNLKNFMLIIMLNNSEMKIMKFYIIIKRDKIIKINKIKRFLINL